MERKIGLSLGLECKGWVFQQYCVMLKVKAERGFLCTSQRGLEHCLRMRKQAGQKVVQWWGPVRFGVIKLVRGV